MTIIRRATATDSTELFKLVVDFATSFEPTRQAFDASLERLLTSEACSLLIAEGEDGVQGYLLAFDHDTFYANAPVAWVEEVIVREDKRRQGIGEALMEAMEAWTVKHGAKLVSLATRRAAPFYLALGYEESAAYFRKLL